MKLKYKRLIELPAIVRSFCHNNDGWIVGGAAMYLLGLIDEKPRDYDICIPLHNWNRANKTVPRGTPANSWGGFKITEGDVEVDIWANDIGVVLADAHPEYLPLYAVQPRTWCTLTADNKIDFE